MEKPPTTDQELRDAVGSWAMQTVLHAINQRAIAAGQGITAQQAQGVMAHANLVCQNLWGAATQEAGEQAPAPAVCQRVVAHVLGWCSAHLQGLVPHPGELHPASILYGWGRQTLLNSMAVRADSLGKAPTRESSMAAFEEASRVNEALWKRSAAGRPEGDRDPEFIAIFSRAVFEWCADHMRGVTPKVRG
ncbi:MAG: hypothetical protein FJ255_07955 [Phycisphaerae bacterium]|nr:hypothetical protein [Phycisphaerae bacterium]